MTSQLQETINLARSLSFSEQLELLKILYTIVQQTDSLEKQTASTEINTEFFAESFSKS